jgi:hypothetical protein
VTREKAVRVALALGTDVECLFVRLVTLARAAADRGLERTTLRAAVDAGKVKPDRLERRDDKTRVYFIEANLDAQLERLPSCKVEGCAEKALAPSGYCTVHKWHASHEKIRRAVAQPIEERLWLTQDEVSRQTGRARQVVHRAIDNKKLRAWKVCGVVIVAKADVPEWDESLPPGQHSEAWQDETDGMVRLYESGKSSTTIGKRSDLKPETVLRRLKKEGVQIRKGAPRIHPLAEPRRCENPKCPRPGRWFEPPAANAARGYGNCCSRSCSAQLAWLTATGFAAEKASRSSKWRSAKGGHESSRREYTDEEADELRTLKAAHPCLSLRALARIWTGLYPERPLTKDQVARILDAPPMRL